jgi:hypothetical protein
LIFIFTFPTNPGFKKNSPKLHWIGFAVLRRLKVAQISSVFWPLRHKTIRNSPATDGKRNGIQPTSRGLNTILNNREGKIIGKWIRLRKVITDPRGKVNNINNKK